jgi:probable HAF family extracellular repeat protein
MRVTWLRSLLRKKGVLGIAIVGAVLLLSSSRRRGMAFGIAIMCLGLFVLFTDRPARTPAPAPKTLSAAGYALTEVGVLPDGRYSVPTSVNDAGQVAGYTVTKDRYARAFLWTSGKTAPLGTLGGPLSLALGANNRGQAVGWSTTLQRDLRGFVWTDGKMQPLQTLGGDLTAAEAINDAGQIAGAADNRNGDLLATLWQDGKPRSLGVLSRGDMSIASGINASGDVVGYSGSCEVRGFLYRNGKMAPLPGLGGASSYAASINADGSIVGSAEARNGEDWHAVLWQSGKIRDLGTLGGSDSDAYGINDRGEVVGASLTAGQEPHAFLWRDGRMVDLNTLIPAKLGWVLQSAMAINNDGAIVGFGAAGGQYRGFLLTPASRQGDSASSSSSFAPEPHGVDSASHDKPLTFDDGRQVLKLPARLESLPPGGPMSKALLGGLFPAPKGL